MSSKATRVMAMAGRCGAALVGAVIVLAVPSLAGAATVAEVDGTGVFTAAPGESSNVAANERNISDAGALLPAGAGCTQVDAHSVTCGEEFTGQLPLVVNAGDRNDRVFLS